VVVLNSAGSFNRTCKYDAVNSVDDESLSMIHTDDNYSRTKLFCWTYS